MNKSLDGIDPALLTGLDRCRKVVEMPLWSRNTDTSAAKWNQPWDPPSVNDRVYIKLNGWECKGTVVGYNADYGWLMIVVRPDSRPDWHIKEMPNRHECMFAGIELRPL